MNTFTGVVVKTLADGIVLNHDGVEKFLPVDELLGSTPEARLSALANFDGSELEVACLEQDPAMCSDGVCRPVVSMWAIEQARRAHERNEIIAAVKSWDKNGGGNATVVEIQPERGFCLVRPDGQSFVALLHVKDMAGGQDNLTANNERLSKQLKVGDKLPVALKEEPRVKNFRPAIRLKEKN